MDRVRDLVASHGRGAVELVVLAQDRDRFAREPAYHYLLDKEIEEQGCALKALNDCGDDSPEGELTDGILDQLATYERAKITERSRRGKLRKAREGKFVAGPRPNFGFRYNESRDGYEVHEEAINVVRRIFRMVSTEGVSTHMVARILESEGVRSPAGGRYWYKRVVKRLILEDVYKPHAFKEVEPFVSPEVAVRLDPNKHYGIWWFGRRRTNSTQLSEANPDGPGRTYRKKTRVVARDKGEWIAVPVPGAEYHASGWTPRVRFSPTTGLLEGRRPILGALRGHHALRGVWASNGIPSKDLPNQAGQDGDPLLSLPLRATLQGAVLEQQVRSRRQDAQGGLGAGFGFAQGPRQVAHRPRGDG
jgi:hypothetical protein